MKASLLARNIREVECRGHIAEPILRHKLQSISFASQRKFSLAPVIVIYARSSIAVFMTSTFDDIAPMVISNKHTRERAKKTKPNHQFSRRNFSPVKKRKDEY
jgi:hypothetical protein